MHAHRSLGIAASLATFGLVLVVAPSATAAGLSSVNGMAGPAQFSARGGVTTSKNWSGYALTGGTYTYATGSWTVPTATCAKGEDSMSSTWVGLDGWGSNTVEQLGSTTGCIFGIPTYIPWTEMYPKLPAPIKEKMSPGDSMTGSVTASDGGTSYLLVLTDHTKGWTYQTTKTTSLADKDMSAEWITELPTCPIFCKDLTDFGSVTFTGATATGNGTTGPISSFAGYQSVDMEDAATIQASVGSLAKNGEGFTDTWLHA